MGDPLDVEALHGGISTSCMAHMKDEIDLNDGNYNSANLPPEIVVTNHNQSHLLRPKYAYDSPGSLIESSSKSQDALIRSSHGPPCRKSFADSAPASASWLALLGTRGDSKGRLDQQRSITALHLADDALSGRVTANSGVSFCISRSSLQSSIVEATQQQINPNVNSAIVEPAPYQAITVTTEINQPPASATRGMILTFADVGYTLAKKRRRSKWSSSGKQILHGITGCVMPGEMLALMGPSGSGKTTLLNILGGRNQSDDVNTMKGTILYDGASYSKTLKRKFGFVTQDDMLYPHLTVKETLTYAALLRLPASMSRQRKTDKADHVIHQLGLERCRDTVIGNAFLRGVSGGERKRVCIGHEILIDPLVLFLDEPTSGLDSTTALRIMHLLQSLAQVGKSIVTTIHQPSSRLFYLFDKLLLLADGHCVYFGKARHALQHMEAQGFAPLVPMNPADFLLDVCSGNTYDMKVPVGLVEEAPEQLGVERPKVATFTKEVVEYLLDCNAREGATLKELRGGSLPCVEEKAPAFEEAQERAWAVGWRTQVIILLERGLKERRHDYLGWLKVTQVMATALLCGTLWWHSNANSLSDLEDQVGLLFFIGLFWGFFPLFNAIFTFPLERALLAKERSSDMYRLSAYFVARSISDLPLDLLLPTCFVTLVYFMATLRMSLAAFSLSMLAVHLTVITAQGVGLLIGAAMMDVKKATTFGSVFVIALMLVAGFFIQRVPKYVAWMEYFSFQSYCYKLLLKIQYYPYHDIQICYSGGTTTLACKQALLLNKALHGMRLSSGVEEVWCLMALSILSRFLAYLSLRKMKIKFLRRRITHCECYTTSHHNPKHDK